ncbi:MAG: DoxX family protein [Planctomycetes bacterium]|nr:DoxX family protein [Planctomycetota bacterium]
MLATDRAAAPVVLRATLALAMFPHGAQKALGWFGGHGFSGTVGFLTGQAGLPWLVAVGVIFLELLGPLLLLAGVGVRAVALAFVGLMVGAIAKVHWANGFFMNWFGQQSGEGFEYHLLVIGLAAALVASGAGAWSLDRRWGSGRA